MTITHRGLGQSPQVLLAHLYLCTKAGTTITTIFLLSSRCEAETGVTIVGSLGLTWWRLSGGPLAERLEGGGIHPIISTALYKKWPDDIPSLLTQLPYLLRH